MVEYFHKIIDKYQSQLDDLEVGVKQLPDGSYPISEREKKFNELKPQIEKEFEDKYKSSLILVKCENDWKRKEKKIISTSVFLVEYLHEFCYSRIIIKILDLIAQEWVNVSLNCYVEKDLNTNISFLDAIKLLNKRKE